MIDAYLDSSAAAKLLVEEAESSALERFLAGIDDLVSSFLLETDLRRLAVRLDLSQTAVSQLLSRVTLAEPDRAVFREAGLLPDHRLRSLDAIHLATAIRFDAGVVVAYDGRMLDAAQSLGLATASPS
jgi:predicted nucleic acid-binding protein